MSSRGGRGGRGRGYTPPSGASLYLKRSAKEAGLDDRNLRDIAKPCALFPPLTWHSNGTIWNEEDDDDIPETTTKRTSQVVYMIQKGRDIRNRMQTLYQGPSQEQDVKRYRDKKQQEKVDVTSMSLTGVARRLGTSYVPQELLPVSSTASTKLYGASREKAASAPKKAPGTNLQVLEEKEKTGGEENVEETLALDETYDQPSEEEDEAADYTMNYYESEGEEGDGGGDEGEPTF
jgi:hypothetical protein